MAKPAESETTHPLLEPRVLAAIAVVALGCGVGFGLMIAKLFITIGLLLSLASAVAVLWIYWAHFKSAYVALRYRQVYSGIGVGELIISLVVVIAVVPLSISIYFAESKEDPIINRAVMEYGGAALDPSGVPGIYRIKVVFGNKGNLIATNAIGIVAASLADKPLDSASVTQMLDYFASILDRAEKKFSGSKGREIDFDNNIVVHALRVDQNLSPTDLQHADNSNLFLVDQESLRDVSTGKKSIYILYVQRWEDGSISGEWENRGCILNNGLSVVILNLAFLRA
jgi:hypothetical protein